MHNKIKRKDFGTQVNKIISIIGLGCLAVSFVVAPSLFMGKVLSLMLVISVVYPILKSLKTSDYHLTVLLAFMSSYVFVAVNYFWLGKHIVRNNPCEGIDTVFKVLQILSLFHFVLLYSLKFSKARIERQLLLKESNSLMFVFLIVISSIITIFGSTGQSIFESGGYLETIQSRESSSFFAYNLIPLSLAFIYANTSMKRKVVFIAIALFCGKDLLFGGRVDTIQLLLILFFIKYQYLWKKKKIILFAGIGVVFMSIWGDLRGNVDMSMIDIYISLSKQYLDSNSAFDYQIGNAADVYYASVRILFLIKENILTFELRIISFICFFLSVFVPFSYLPEVANLASFMQKDYWSGGGGLAPVFFYAFAGYIGVLAFSFLVSHCMNLYQNLKSSKFVRYYAILMLATTPRWYAYYPIQIIKFCLIGTLIYYLIDRISKENK